MFTYYREDFCYQVVFKKGVQGVGWVQPFRKHWMLSFKTAKMTFNSRKSTFLCGFIAIHHSFSFSDVLWRGVSRPQRPPPPGSAPDFGMLLLYNELTFVLLKLLFLFPIMFTDSKRHQFVETQEWFPTKWLHTQ